MQARQTFVKCCFATCMTLSFWFVDTLCRVAMCLSLLWNCIGVIRKYDLSCSYRGKVWWNCYCLMLVECNYTVIVIVKNCTLPISGFHIVFSQVISKSLQSSLIRMGTLAEWGSMTMALGSNRKLIQMEKEANMIMNDFMLNRK